MLLAFMLGALGASVAILSVQWYFDRLRERSIDRMVQAYRAWIDDLEEKIKEYEQEGWDG